MNKEFNYSYAGCCTNPNANHITYMIGDVSASVYTACHKGKWLAGFEMKAAGKQLWRPCAIGYPSFNTEREAKYAAFQGLIDALYFYLDQLYGMEWQFGEDDEDPAYDLEEWFITDIQKLKIEQAYYDEDVIFDLEA